jgi:hypothetical protein
MRATKADQAIAERVGRPASTVVRHRTGGMWPLDPMAKIERHYEVMDACRMGEGRDNWIVALDAAVQFGWPVAMLRPVLADPPALDADRFVSRVRALVVTLARGIEGLQSYDEPASGSTADLAEAIADDMFSGVSREVHHEETTAADFDDFADGVDATIDLLTDDGTVYDDAGDDTDRRLSHDVRNEIRGLVDRVSTWRPWAQEASPDSLVHALVVADRTVALLDALSPLDAPRSDERWKELAMLAPWCGAELIPMGFDHRLPALGRLVTPPRSADDQPGPEGMGRVTS